VLVLGLSGRLGRSSAVALADTLADALGRGDIRLVLDLSQMDYISSAALQSIESAAAECDALEGALVLCGVGAPVRIALEIAGALTYLPIEPSLEAAIGRFSRT